MPGNYPIREKKIPKEEEERRVNEAEKEIQKVYENILDRKESYKKTNYLNLKSYFKSYIMGGMLLVQALNIIMKNLNLNNYFIHYEKVNIKFIR